MKVTTRVCGGAAAILVTALIPGGLIAQAPVPADSILNVFIRDGSRASPTPNIAFIGCPNLEPWQNEIFGVLSTAPLSPQRSEDLALVWLGARRACPENAELEEWFVEGFLARLEAAPSDEALGVHWMAMEIDSPRVRDVLRGVARDLRIPASQRSRATATLLDMVAPSEKLDEFVSLFRDDALPLLQAAGYVERLYRQQPERLLAAMTREITTDPRLAARPATEQLANMVRKDTRQAPRESLRRTLESASDAGSLSPAERAQIQLVIGRIGIAR